ncbi:hypothetical protein PM082_000512 [Marasmius tenuissimus]|nr:hypothetical protein PM082_000512 [Marasmius tenuissimus]
MPRAVYKEIQIRPGVRGKKIVRRPCGSAGPCHRSLRRVPALPALPNMGPQTIDASHRDPENWESPTRKSRTQRRQHATLPLLALKGPLLIM